MTPTQTTMVFRLPDDLKDAFNQVALDQDLTASQLLRALIRQAIADHEPPEPLPRPRKAPKPPGKALAPPKAKKPAKRAGSPLLNALLKRS